MTTVKVIPVPFRVLSQNLCTLYMTGIVFVLEYYMYIVVPLWGENELEPCMLICLLKKISDNHPQHRILSSVSIKLEIIVIYQPVLNVVTFVFQSGVMKLHVQCTCIKSF